MFLYCSFLWHIFTCHCEKSQILKQSTICNTFFRTDGLLRHCVPRNDKDFIFAKKPNGFCGNPVILFDYLAIARNDIEAGRMQFLHQIFWISLHVAPHNGMILFTHIFPPHLPHLTKTWEKKVLKNCLLMWAKYL